jgi:hypothetical protein
MTKTSNNIDEINLAVRAVGVILDSATRALDWVREALHQSLSTTFFNATTPEYRILVKRDRSKANYAIVAIATRGVFDEQS